MVYMEDTGRQEVRIILFNPGQTEIIANQSPAKINRNNLLALFSM